MTWNRTEDAIPEFDTENADGGMSVGDQDGGVSEVGASGQDGGVVILGNPWRRIAAAASSFIRL